MLELSSKRGGRRRCQRFIREAIRRSATSNGREDLDLSKNRGTERRAGTDAEKTAVFREGLRTEAYNGGAAKPHRAQKISEKRMKKSKKLKKLLNKGFRGYPIATIAYYGPDDKRATKVAVGIVPYENAEPSNLKRWFNEDTDIRKDRITNEEIIEFVKENETKSVVMADRIMGCPHEEGVDYPDGSKCTKCLFWAIRDRFTGETIQ